MSKLHQINIMPTPETSSNSNTTNSTTTSPISTRLPGVDNALVIPSSPIFIKENSYKPSNKKK